MRALRGLETTSNILVMRGSPSRATHPPTEQTHAYDSKMSILAMSQPPTHAAFKRHYGWEDSNRHSDFASRPRTEPEKIALPSIRQVCSKSVDAELANLMERAGY